MKKDSKQKLVQMRNNLNKIFTDEKIQKINRWGAVIFNEKRSVMLCLRDNFERSDIFEDYVNHKKIEDFSDCYIYFKYRRDNNGKKRLIKYCSFSEESILCDELYERRAIAGFNLDLIEHILKNLNPDNANVYFNHNCALLIKDQDFIIIIAQSFCFIDDIATIDEYYKETIKIPYKIYESYMKKSRIELVNILKRDFGFTRSVSMPKSYLIMTIEQEKLKNISYNLQ